MNPAVLRVSIFLARISEGMIADRPNSKSWDDRGQSVSWSFADNTWRSKPSRR